MRKCTLLLVLAVGMLAVSSAKAQNACPSQNETQLLMTLTSAYSSLSQAATSAPGINNQSPLYRYVSDAEGYVNVAEDNLNKPKAALDALKSASALILDALKQSPPPQAQQALGNASNLIAATVIGLQLDAGQNGAVGDLVVADQLILQLHGDPQIAQLVTRINVDLTQAEANITSPNNVTYLLSDALQQIPLLTSVVPSGSLSIVAKAETYINKAIAANQNE